MSTTPETMVPDHGANYVPVGAGNARRKVGQYAEGSVATKVVMDVTDGSVDGSSK